LSELLALQSMLGHTLLDFGAGSSVEQLLNFFVI